MSELQITRNLSRHHDYLIRSHYCHGHDYGNHHLHSPSGKSDASLFIDHEGTRYLVWGGGMIAPLKDPDVLGKLKPNEAGYNGTPVFLPTRVEGFYTDTTLPQHGAPSGVSVVRLGDEFSFHYSATTLRDGKPSEDAYICRATDRKNWTTLAMSGRSTLRLGSVRDATAGSGSKPRIPTSLSAPTPTSAGPSAPRRSTT